MSIHLPLAVQSTGAIEPPNANPALSSPLHQQAIRAELTRDLLAVPARVAPKYLYDTLGSKLFEALCLLPEYYPTRTEAAIVQNNLAEISRVAGRRITLIDIGAGNCVKAERLFASLKPSHYVAVDISADFLHKTLERLQCTYPNIVMTALGQDFSQGLTLPDSIPDNNRLYFYPGSSLGNFTPQEARYFLKHLHQHSAESASLLLGVDLVKETSVLNAAYDDPLGLTSAFNLNLLRHLNRILEADFNVQHWSHFACFNEADSRVEMYLQAQCSTQVRWPGAQRQFKKGERIHTENSYKYTRASLTALLLESGWQPTHFWTDPKEWFALVHAQAGPSSPTTQQALK